jgi:O-antigen/teichoic acid export membrane protein
MIFKIGGDSELGLFSSGFLLLSMLPSVLFAALDSEYYPRLSAAFGNVDVRNAMVNEQIEVHSLIQTPIILSVVLLLPFVFPILYSNEYIPAVAMTQGAMFGLLFHVLTYPISFMALSKGDVLVFILQESVYNIANVVLVVGGYYFFGLKGVGFAILLVRVLDFVVVFSITYLRYGFRLSQCSRKYLFMNMFCALILFCSVFLLNGVVAWIFSSLSVLLSIALSVYFLAHHGDIFNKILKRLKLKR